MQKRIFSYFDGKETVWADPLAIQRKWWKAGEKVDIETILSQFYGPPFIQNFVDGIPCDEDGVPIPDITEDMIIFAFKMREEATTELCPVLYETFGLSPIDPKTGEGTTQSEIIDAFNSFQLFMYEVKKNTEMNLNSPQSIQETNSELPIPREIQDSSSTNESAVSSGTKTEQSESIPFP